MMGAPESIVITGRGTVLPCGDGWEAARASWEAQKPCFAALPEALGHGWGAACLECRPAGIIPPLVNRRLDRHARFAWVAAHQAFAEAGLEPRTMGERVAIAVGTMGGGSEASEAFMEPYLDRGPEGASPMVFPNCVAVAISGHLATAFGIKGPSTTQMGRENSTFVALEQAVRWLRSGRAEAALVVGTDGLFPLLTELLFRCRLQARHGGPRAHSGHGMLPGEGAQAFVLEIRSAAEARGARICGILRGLASLSSPEVPDRRAWALEEAARAVSPGRPDAWIGGANGHRILDDVEAPLGAAHPAWPAPRFPKLLWGEFCGSGGQLLAAALLDPASAVLVTAPASRGPQYAALVEKPADSD